MQLRSEPDAPVDDHAVIQLGDGAAAGAHEEKGQHTVHQACDAGEHHAGAEVHGPNEVLAVGLADRRRMLREGTNEVHITTVASEGRYPVAKAW